MRNYIIIQSNNGIIKLKTSGATVEDEITKNYKWLVQPLIKSLGSYQKAIEHLNWKIYIK
jgi:hypothetical protein